MNTLRQQWLTVKEAAARLNVTPSTIYEAVGRGLLGCHRVRSRPGSRGAIRITEEHLREYLAGGPAGAARKLRHIR